MYKFGRLLSTIVSQNVAILIAIGLIRAVFGVYGWFPNDNVNLLIGPLLNWLVPVLFGYTGGHLMGGKRGATVAAVVLFGLALASTVSMIFMAVLLGPVIGWIVRQIERMLENRLPSGFELLMVNFISAVLAGVLAVFCFTYVGQTLSSLIIDLNERILAVAYSGWLPISAVIIEPSKVLFLNNLMSYGVLGPLGISQIKDLSKSIFFLLESNPGPAMGMLLAYVIRLKGKPRGNAANTLAIHSLGGIQEVYFPYVLMRPQLLLPLIAGNMAGIFAFQWLDAGLVSIPSPASLILIVGLAPPDDTFYVLFGIFLSAAVSFTLSLLVVKAKQEVREHVVDNREHDVVHRLVHVQHWSEVRNVLRPVSRVVPNDTAVAAEVTTEAEVPKNPVPDKDHIRTVCFACDAGMGSSAMGAAIMRKKLRSSSLSDQVTVLHSSLDQIPEHADLIVTHHYLLKRAMDNAPGKHYASLSNYTDPAAYEMILDQLRTLIPKVEAGGSG